jgi:peptidylprolyl isomerase
MNESSELKVTDIQVGTGREAVKGAKITVHYDGFLDDGRKFDSSKDRGRPFAFVLGTGKVIKGWDQGLMGMKEGGRRKLEIPAELAYGSRAVGSIPPNSNLIFEIELLESLPRE